MSLFRAVCQGSANFDTNRKHNFKKLRDPKNNGIPYTLMIDSQGIQLLKRKDAKKKKRKDAPYEGKHCFIFQTLMT